MFPSRPSWLRPVALAAVMVAAILVTYAWSLRGEFLWDDDLHITANPTIIGPLGLKEIWTTARANYFPLVLTNFWAQHALWGLEPLGYRVVTLLFHAGAALLLWRVLQQLRVPGAWLGAALWALHPVQVESVAWICELKNTQSAVFFLAAIACYVRWLEAGRSDERERVEGFPLAHARGYNSYALALLCAVLAILSKPSTVMLPVALLLVGVWLRRRVEWREVVLLIPFFALSALAAGWTIWEQKHHSGALGEAWSQTLAERAVIAGRVVWFYLGKLIWPEPLIFIYPRWSIAADSVLALVPAAAVVAGLAGLWRVSRTRPAFAGVFFAAAFFVALLFPVLGFFNIYFFRYSFVGDHFQYLASMGPLALAGAGLARLTQTANGADGAAPSKGDPIGGRRAVAAVGTRCLGGVLIALLAVLTVRESREYVNSETLWRATVARNPSAIMAWLNLGGTLVQNGKLDEAVATFTHVTRIKPDDVDAFNDLGGALLLLGRRDEALVALERAVVLAPQRAEMHNNLGNAQRSLGRSPDAIASYERALALDPAYAAAHDNLGAELAEAGQAQEALTHFEAALRIEPKNAVALNNLGNALRTLGRVEEAMVRHREALRLKPEFSDARGSLGYDLVLAGRAAEGLPLLEQAVRERPDHAGIRGYYGRALALQGRVDEARTHFARAVELTPFSVEARNNLGTALAQLGRGAEAIAEFEQAVRLAPRFAVARINLGNALLAGARWESAAVHFEQAALLRPEDADVQGRLAVARVNSGKIAEAVPAFTAALRLNPNSAELHDHFAQALRALGRNREALEHFERAADLRRAKR